MTGHRRLVGFVLVALLGVVAGCNSKKNTGGGDPPPPAAMPKGGPQAGGPKAMFDVHCAKCHTIDAAGKKGKGPDLSRVGGEPGHTAEWIAEHIRDPKKHKPNSTMPSFETTLDAEQVKTLADWLAGMK